MYDACQRLLKPECTTVIEATQDYYIIVWGGNSGAWISIETEEEFIANEPERQDTEYDNLKPINGLWAGDYTVIKVQVEKKKLEDEKMLRLYNFYWDCGRMGDVEGLFVAEEEEVEKAIGKEIYFGDILGKHSEIYGELTWDALSILSSDKEKVEWLVEIIGSRNISGYNPLNYLPEDEDED